MALFEILMPTVALLPTDSTFYTAFGVLRPLKTFWEARTLKFRTSTLGAASAPETVLPGPACTCDTQDLIAPPSCHGGDSGPKGHSQQCFIPQPL